MAASERVGRCVLARFAPGCAAALLSVVGGVGLIAPDQVTGRMVIVAGTELAAMTAGFALVLNLGGFRPGTVRRLGVRSTAAGLSAPIVAGLMSVLLPAANLTTIAAASTVAGVLAGGAALQLYRLARPARLPQLNRSGAEPLRG